MHEAHGCRFAGPGMAAQYAIEDRFEAEAAVKRTTTGDYIESGKIVLNDGLLLMSGERAEWPPRDMDGTPVRIGSRVYGVRDSCNFQDEHEFTVGSLRLQYQGGSLAWVACAYDDDERYFEAWAEDCKVLDGVPQCG